MFDLARFLTKFVFFCVPLLPCVAALAVEGESAGWVWCALCGANKRSPHFCPHGGSSSNGGFSVAPSTGSFDVTPSTGPINIKPLPGIQFGFGGNRPTPVLDALERMRDRPESRRRLFDGRILRRFQDRRVNRIDVPVPIQNGQAPYFDQGQTRNNFPAQIQQDRTTESRPCVVFSDVKQDESGYYDSYYYSVQNIHEHDVYVFVRVKSRGTEREVGVPLGPKGVTRIDLGPIDQAILQPGYKVREEEHLLKSTLVGDSEGIYTLLVYNRLNYPILCDIQDSIGVMSKWVYPRQIKVCPVLARSGTIVFSATVYNHDKTFVIGYIGKEQMNLERYSNQRRHSKIIDTYIPR